METKVRYLDQDGHYKCGQVLGNSSSLLMISIALLLLDGFAFLSDVLGDFIDSLTGNIFYQDHGEVLAAVDVDQAADVLGLVLDELNLSKSDTFPNTSFPLTSGHSSKSLPMALMA